MDTFHVWGDSWSHWEELYEAEQYIVNYVYKYSRCHISMKEKYGTLRYEWIFAPGGGFSIGFRVKVPFIKVKKKYIEEKQPIYIFTWQYSYIYKLWIRYGKYVLDKAVKSACVKFPNCKAEILDDYSPEYL